MPDKPLVHALGFSPWKRPLVRRFLHDCQVQFIRSEEEVPEQATLAVWASGPYRDCLAGSPTVQRWLLEDGFLRSVGLGADLIVPLSWVVDRRGIYYASSQPSDLEVILQTEEFDDDLLARARSLRETLLVTGVTKYNIGKASWLGLSPEAANRKEVVLVVGQVESDASIRTATPGIRTNMDLLRAARAQHPQAWLAYKPHPDVVARLRRRGIGENEAQALCDEVVVEAPMAQLLQSVDVVHVLTSLAGFEALVRGKRVVCHGLPFYAGWGLTQDQHASRRRTRRLEIDQLVAGALILYPRYMRRDGVPCTAEEALAELLRWRARGYKGSRWTRVALRPALRMAASMTHQASGSARASTKGDHSMISRPIFRLFMKTCAEHIARALYQGLLGRQADPTGLVAYSKAISKTSNLDRIVEDFAASPEARRHFLNTNIEVILREVQSGLRPDDPGADSLQAWASQFREGRNLGSIVMEMSQRAIDTARRQDLYEQLVVDTFRGLLGRLPDEISRKSYLTNLQSTNDVAGFINELGNSSEHRLQLLKRGGIKTYRDEPTSSHLTAVESIA